LLLLLLQGWGWPLDGSCSNRCVSGSQSSVVALHCSASWVCQLVRLHLGLLVFGVLVFASHVLAWQVLGATKCAGNHDFCL
jgi:hypothetical protein